MKRNKNGSAPKRPNARQGSVLTVSQKNVLVELFNALCGVVSERGTEFFNRYHPAGGEKMMLDFEKLLEQVTPESFKEVDANGLTSSPSYEEESK